MWQQIRLNFLSWSEPKATSRGSKLRTSSCFDLELAAQTHIFVWSESPTQDRRCQTSAFQQLSAEGREMDIVDVKTSQAYRLYLRNWIHLKKLKNLYEFNF